MNPLFIGGRFTVGERIELPPFEALTGDIGKLAAAWKDMGSDTTFIRMLNYRADLVPAFFDFYMRIRRDIERWSALSKEAGIQPQ